jgi:hypothetical protein
MEVTQGLKATRDLGDQPCSACVCTNICDSRQLPRYEHDRQAGHSLMAGRREMNMIALSQSRPERGRDKSVGLNGFDTTRTQLLLDAGNVGLPHSRRDTLATVVAPELQDHDLGAFRDAA